MYKIFLIFLLGILTLANADEDKMLQTGKKLYNETCVSCHGQNGETNQAMHLVVKPRVLQKSILTQDQMFQIIKEGAHAFGSHADIMPTFKYVYNDKQIASLALYVSKTFNTKRNLRVKKLLTNATKLSLKQKEQRIKVGKKIFQRKCAMCHGKTGNGQSEYVEESKMEKDFIYPYNLQNVLLTEEQIFLYAKYGGHFWGTAKDDMPSWKRKYNDVQLKSVAHYVATQIQKSKK